MLRGVLVWRLTHVTCWRARCVYDKPRRRNRKQPGRPGNQPKRGGFWSVAHIQNVSPQSLFSKDGNTSSFRK